LRWSQTRAMASSSATVVLSDVMVRACTWSASKAAACATSALLLTVASTRVNPKPLAASRMTRIWESELVSFGL